MIRQNGFKNVFLGRSSQRGLRSMVLHDGTYHNFSGYYQTLNNRFYITSVRRFPNQNVTGISFNSVSFQGFQRSLSVPVFNRLFLPNLRQRY